MGRVILAWTERLAGDGRTNRTLKMGSLKVYEGWRYQFYADTLEHRKLLRRMLGIEFYKIRVDFKLWVSGTAGGENGGDVGVGE